MGVMIDPCWGGSGADFVSYALAMEEISAADVGISNMMAANNSPVAMAIQNSGSEQHKRDYLTKLTNGEWLGCFHLTEPHAGSNAAAIRTRAVRDGDEYVLDGHEAFITGGSTADVAMIVAVTDPDAGKRGITTFITPTDNPGYRVIATETKLGHRTNDTCQVVFEDMRVPVCDVLGETGRGLGIALTNLSLGRIGVAAQAIQIHGGYGFLNDCPVEKIYRDVRVYQIYEGTSEVQKMLISRMLDGMDL